jgi:hypothetical protein
MLSLMSFPPIVVGGQCLRKWLRNRDTSARADF